MVPVMVAFFPVGVLMIWVMFENETLENSFKYGLGIIRDTWEGY